MNAVAPAHSPRMIGMGRAILIIGSGALAVGLVIYALIECAQSERYRVRAVPKGAWLLIILLLPVVGAVLWLFFGRPRTDDAARDAARGRGPDDDPQFLRNLEERRKQQEQARKLQEWENELKRTGQAPGAKPQVDEPLDPSDPRWTDPTTGSHAADDSLGGTGANPGSGRSTGREQPTDENPSAADGTGRQHPENPEGEPPRHD